MQYDYRCPDCNTVLTIERSIHEEPREPSCFDCHIPMIRKWDSPGVTFKGKGFYSTGGQCYTLDLGRQFRLMSASKNPTGSADGVFVLPGKG